MATCLDTYSFDSEEVLRVPWDRVGENYGENYESSSGAADSARDFSNLTIPVIELPYSEGENLFEDRDSWF